MLFLNYRHRLMTLVGGRNKVIQDMFVKFNMSHYEHVRRMKQHSGHSY